MVDTCLRLEYGIVFRVLSNFSTRNCSLVLAVPVASRDGDTEEGDEWDKIEPLFFLLLGPSARRHLHIETCMSGTT